MGGGNMVAHISMKSRYNTSSILPGPLYYINNFSSPCSVVIHSLIWRREFTVPSLFPLLASNTDLMTSLSIFGNISSIWKISKKPTWQHHSSHLYHFFQQNGSSCNWPSTKKWRVREGVSRWLGGQTEMMMSSRRRRRSAPCQDSNPSQPFHSLIIFQIMSHWRQNSDCVKRGFPTNQYWNIAKMFLYNHRIKVYSSKGYILVLSECVTCFLHTFLTLCSFTAYINPRYFLNRI